MAHGSDFASPMSTFQQIAGGLYTLSASLIWGINTMFLLRVGGLTLLEVFIANAVFTGSMALFEVPTGIVADTRGRRLSFGVLARLRHELLQTHGDVLGDPGLDGALGIGQGIGRAAELALQRAEQGFQPAETRLQRRQARVEIPAVIVHVVPPRVTLAQGAGRANR